jgi:hypothetical protein
MTTSLLKKNITKAVNEINDQDFLQAVFTIVSTKTDTDFELTPALKKELDKRKESHQKGLSKSYTWEQVKKAALN